MEMHMNYNKKEKAKVAPVIEAEYSRIHVSDVEDTIDVRSTLDMAKTTIKRLAYAFVPAAIVFGGMLYLHGAGDSAVSSTVQHERMANLMTLKVHGLASPLTIPTIGVEDYWTRLSPAVLNGDLQANKITPENDTTLYYYKNNVDMHAKLASGEYVLKSFVVEDNMEDDGDVISVESPGWSAIVPLSAYHTTTVYVPVPVGSASPVKMTAYIDGAGGGVTVSIYQNNLGHDGYALPALNVGETVTFLLD